MGVPRQYLCRSLHDLPFEKGTALEIARIYSSKGLPQALLANAASLSVLVSLVYFRILLDAKSDIKLRGIMGTFKGT